MRTRIQATQAYELTADITPTAYGHHLQLISFVPTARRPQEQVKFKALLSYAELKELQLCVERALLSPLPVAKTDTSFKG